MMSIWRNFSLAIVTLLLVQIESALGEYYEKKPGYGCKGFEDINLGTSFQTPQECGAAALANPACTGTEIMWSPYSSRYGCLCCKPGIKDDAYVADANWNVWDDVTVPPTPAPVYSAPPCAKGEVELKVSIVTDNFPVETGWKVVNDCTGEEVESPAWFYRTPGGTEEKVLCVPAKNKFTFTITDWQGDGICCQYGNGKYSVALAGVKVASGSQFLKKESTSFGTCPTPAPTPAPTKAAITTRSALRFKGRYCRDQKVKLGVFKTPDLCAATAKKYAACTANEIMFSSSSSPCVCCGTRFSSSGSYPAHQSWNIYQYR